MSEENKEWQFFWFSKSIFKAKELVNFPENEFCVRISILNEEGVFLILSIFDKYHFEKICIIFVGTTQVVLQDIKKSFDNVHMGAKSY